MPVAMTPLHWVQTPKQVLTPLRRWVPAPQQVERTVPPLVRPATQVVLIQLQLARQPAPVGLTQPQSVKEAVPTAKVLWPQAAVPMQVEIAHLPQVPRLLHLAIVPWQWATPQMLPVMMHWLWVLRLRQVAKARSL